MYFQDLSGDTTSPALTLEALVDDLCAGRIDTLSHLFAVNGAAAPQIIWSPTQCDNLHPIVDHFARQMAALADDRGRVAAADFDLDDFATLSKWMMVLDPFESGTRFRYVHYGSVIADHLGRDMTGQSTDAFPGHIGQFFTALYRAAASRGEWVFASHEPPAPVFVATWQRLIVPLFGPSGDVTRFAVANVPENGLRAGLEAIPEPVILADADKIVRFANRAARQLFVHSDAVPMIGFSDFTGTDLALGDSPDDLVRLGRVEDHLCLGISDKLLHEFSATVSATRHRGQSFYVVCLRLTG